MMNETTVTTSKRARDPGRAGLRRAGDLRLSGNKERLSAVSLAADVPRRRMRKSRDHPREREARWVVDSTEPPTLALRVVLLIE